MHVEGDFNMKFVEGVIEFCAKVLKLEIMNSRNLFNYSSRAVPRTIEFVQYVTLFPWRFKS
jgi:hypothetical protein